MRLALYLQTLLSCPVSVLSGSREVITGRLCTVQVCRVVQCCGWHGRAPVRVSEGPSVGFVCDATTNEPTICALP